MSAVADIELIAINSSNHRASLSSISGAAAEAAGAGAAKLVYLGKPASHQQSCVGPTILAVVVVFNTSTEHVPQKRTHRARGEILIREISTNEHLHSAS